MSAWDLACFIAVGTDIGVMTQKLPMTLLSVIALSFKLKFRGERNILPIYISLHASIDRQLGKPRGLWAVAVFGEATSLTCSAAAIIAQS